MEIKFHVHVTGKRGYAQVSDWHGMAKQEIFGD